MPNNTGYSQYDRTAFLKHYQNAGLHPLKVAYIHDLDCASFVAWVAKKGGYLQNDSKQKK